MMSVGGRKAKRTQIPLWPWVGDVRYRSMAQTRADVGDFYEEAAAQATGAQRLKTDSTKDICPDLQYAPGVYFENKSVGLSNRLIVYQHRHEKDHRFMQEQGSTFFYFLWRHRVKVQAVKSRHELWADLAAGCMVLVILPIAIVSEVLMASPTRVLNKMNKTPDGKRLGFGSNGYGVGWDIPANQLEERCQASGTLQPFSVYGHDFPSLRVRAGDAACIELLRGVTKSVDPKPGSDSE